MAVYLIKRGTKELRIRQEGDKVLIFGPDGKLVVEVPWKAALTIAKAIRIKAKHAEEHAKAKDIIEDQSLMFRAGMPISLTSDPEKIKEAVKEASWNSKLRRYLPIPKFGNIESKESFGIPMIRKGPPKNNDGGDNES